MVPHNLTIHIAVYRVYIHPEMTQTNPDNLAQRRGNAWEWSSPDSPFIKLTKYQNTSWFALFFKISPWVAPRTVDG